MRKGLILLCAVLILIVVNLGIWQNEQLIKNGETVFLELTPVDPRSLMQGDYMALNFAIAVAISKHMDSNVESLSGHVTVQLDAKKRASFVAIDQQQPLADGQLQLQFRLRNGQVKFATNAFFFQEGTGEIYQAAKYGVFRVGAKGNLILTHLADAELQTLGQSKPLQSTELP